MLHCYKLLQQSCESRCRHWHRRLLYRCAPAAKTGTFIAAILNLFEKNGGLGLVLQRCGPLAFGKPISPSCTKWGLVQDHIANVVEQPGVLNVLWEHMAVKHVLSWSPRHHTFATSHGNVSQPGLYWSPRVKACWLSVTFTCPLQVCFSLLCAEIGHNFTSSYITIMTRYYRIRKCTHRNTVTIQNDNFEPETDL